MKALEEFYYLKHGYAMPTRYLGVEVKQWMFSQDVTKPKRALSSVQYVKEAIHNMDMQLQGLDRKLFTAHQPKHSDYAPELDVTPYLDDKLTYLP
jgi:hypothetical protein